MLAGDFAAMSTQLEFKDELACNVAKELVEKNSKYASYKTILCVKK